MSSCYTYYYNNVESAKVGEKVDIEFRHIPFGDNHYKERNEQIQLRTKECSRIVDFLIGKTTVYNIISDCTLVMLGNKSSPSCG